MAGSAFWALPEFLEVGGVDYPIRTDYRAALSIFGGLADGGKSDSDKADWMGYVLYPGWDTIPAEKKQEALEQAVWFLDRGRAPQEEDAKAPAIVDWAHDWQMIAPACNRVNGGQSIQELPYLHWWNFLGLYQEIGDCLFSTVINIRAKQAKRKKLEKWEKEFIKANPELVKTGKEKEETENLSTLIDDIRKGAYDDGGQIFDD